MSTISWNFLDIVQKNALSLTQAPIKILHYLYLNMTNDDVHVLSVLKHRLKNSVPNFVDTITLFAALMRIHLDR